MADAAPIAYRVNVQELQVPPERDDDGKVIFGGHKVFRSQILTPEEQTVLLRPENVALLRSCVRIALPEDHPHAQSLARPDHSKPQVSDDVAKSLANRPAKMSYNEMAQKAADDAKSASAKSKQSAPAVAVPSVAAATPGPSQHNL